MVFEVSEIIQEVDSVNKSNQQITPFGIDETRLFNMKTLLRVTEYAKRFVNKLLKKRK